MRGKKQSQSLSSMWMVAISSELLNFNAVGVNEGPHHMTVVFGKGRIPLVV